MGKLANITGQGVAMAPRPTLAGVQGPVGALADPNGVGVVDKAALEGRLDQLAEGVVHHPVAERRSGDQPRLGSWMVKLA